MSKITKTKNLNLITYAGENLQPLAKDMTNNMKIIDEAVGTNSAETSQLAARMEAAEDDIMSLREASTTQSGKITSLETQVAQNTHDIQLLQPSTVQDVVDRLETAETNIQSNTNLINALTTRVADDEDNLAQHAIRIGNLEQLIPLIREQQQMLQEAVNNIMTEISGMKQEIVDSQNDIAGLDEKVGNIESDTAGLRTSLNTMGEQIGNISANYDNLQGRMSTTESKVINLDQRVTALEKNHENK